MLLWRANLKLKLDRQLKPRFEHEHQHELQHQRPLQQQLEQLGEDGLQCRGLRVLGFHPMLRGLCVQPKRHMRASGDVEQLKQST